MSVLYKALQKAAQENQAQAEEQTPQAAVESPPVPDPPPVDPVPPAEPPDAAPPPPDLDPEPEQTAVPHYDDDEDEDDGKFDAIMAAPPAAAAPKRGKFLSSSGDKMDVRVMAGGGLVVVLIVVLAFFFLQGGPAPPPQAPSVVQTPAPITSQPAEPAAPIVTAETPAPALEAGAPSVVEPAVDAAADPIVVAEGPADLEPAPILEPPAPIVDDAPVQAASAPIAQPSIVPQRAPSTSSGDVDASQLTPEQMAAIPVDEPMPIVSEDDPARSLSPPISIRRSALALAGVGDAVQVREVSAAARNNASAGYDALVRGDFDTALGFYDLALQDEPNSILSQLGRASALHKLDRFSEAAVAYQAVLRNDPKNREALTNLTAIIGQSSPAEAVRRLQELEREHPNFSPIKAQIGLAQARLGNNTQAVRALSQAANMAPENVMYQYNLAVTLDRMGRGAQAMNAYERTIAAVIQAGEAPQGLSRLAVEQRLNFLRTR